ncbi:MAG: hypothetical protein GOMPHAMPRED_000292 [Gomphillus americanus]|uniref:Ubiquitin-like protease family profile domain-containing protein n=1 Tax=Gomphillus americanus TaxID=1940652 RepID=A0A8H3EAI9_9LECA|nr:MAG: hypothetical protein GOMPHAMPRED_000292 [Gomphillus americanus]
MSNKLSVPTQSIFIPTRTSRNRRSPVEPVTSQSTSSQDPPAEAPRVPAQSYADIAEIPATRLQTVASPSLLTIGSPLNQAIHFQKSSRPGTFGLSKSSPAQQLTRATQNFQVSGTPQTFQSNTDFSTPEEAPRSNKRRGQVGTLGPAPAAPLPTIVITAPNTTTPITTASVATVPATTRPVIRCPVVTVPVTAAPVDTTPFNFNTAPVAYAPASIVTASATATPVITTPDFISPAPVTTLAASTAPVITTPDLISPAPVTTVSVTTAPVSTSSVTAAPAFTAQVTTASVNTSPFDFNTAPATTAPVKETELAVSTSTPQKFESSFRNTSRAITQRSAKPAPTSSTDYNTSISDHKLYELLYEFNRRCSLEAAQPEPDHFLNLPSPPPEDEFSPFADEDFLLLDDVQETVPENQDLVLDDLFVENPFLGDLDIDLPDFDYPEFDDNLLFDKDLVLEDAEEPLEQEDEDLVLENAEEPLEQEDEDLILEDAIVPVQTEDNKQATLPQIVQDTANQKAEEDRFENLDCTTTPAPTTLVVSDSVQEAKDNIVVQSLNKHSIYIPLPIDINNNQSILEGLKHKATHTGDSIDIKAVQVFEQCLTNTITCPAANDIVRPEVRSEIEFLVLHFPGLLHILEQIGSQVIVADLVHLPSYCKLALIITYDTTLACEIQLLLKQRLEEVQRQQELVSLEIAKQEELSRQEWIAAQPLRSLIPDPNRELPIATPVSSSKKISTPKWKVEKRSLSQRSSLFNFSQRSRWTRTEAHPSPFPLQVPHHFAPVKRSKRSQRRVTSTNEKAALRSLVLTNVQRKQSELLQSRPPKRSYQVFLEDDDQPESEEQSLSELSETSNAVLIGKGSKYCVRDSYIKSWPQGFQPRTRSQRSGTYVERVVHKGTRYALTTMLAAKRLCVESLNALSINLEDAQRAMFGREIKTTTTNGAQTTKKSAGPTSSKTHQNDEAETPPSDEKKEGNSIKDFEWDDNPKLNQPTKMSALESRNETSEESRDGSNDGSVERPSPDFGDESPSMTLEDVQNIGLAGLLLDDEKEKSPLRLELSERRAELRSQEQAERQRKAQEEKERKILEEKLRAERLGRIQIPDGSALFQDLSDELEELVERAVNTHQPHKQLCLSFEGVPLHGQDFQRLKPTAWLNDEIINAFIGLNVQHVKQLFGHKRKAIPVAEMFLSGFYSNLEAGNSTGDGAYSKVKRWASRKFVGGQDFLKCNLVITPVNLGNSHWTLLAFWPKHRVVEFYDSFQDPTCSRKVLSLAKEYVEGELASLYVDSEWSFRPGKSPEQHNGYDCGVFVCTTAKLLLLGYEPEVSYTGANMAGQRRRIAAELLTGELTGELQPSLAEDWLR